MTRLLFIFAFFLFSAFSCSKEETTVIPAEQPARVTKVYAPTYGSVGEKISLAVTFTVNNGCGRFSHLQEDKSDNTHTIRVYPKYVGEVCTEALVNLTTIYTFTPAQKGTYTLRFWQKQNNYLVKTIEVR